jgi:hypothetical protein
MVYVFRSNASLVGCEPAVSLKVELVAIVLSGGDLDQQRLVGNVDRDIGLRARQFGLRDVEPASVFWRAMPFEPFDEPPRGGAKPQVRYSPPVRKRHSGSDGVIF